ncbi:MAG: pyridoxal phosphate-dependent aminotransferase, partial [Pseudomonadota bacterium]
MLHFNKRIEQVPPSGIRKFFDLVLGANDIISLGVGEPDFVTPWHVREKVFYSLEQGHTSYTSNWGMQELRKETALYLKQSFSAAYAAEEILITVGVSEGVDITLRTILNEGDEIIVPEPTYVCYTPLAFLAGGVAVPVSNPTFKITADDIEKAVTKKTRAVLLSYPSNPTGYTIDKEELLKIAEIARKYDLWIISDEIYAELTYEKKHFSISAIPEVKERVILLNGFSKAFAMTGWRGGIMAAPKWIAQACDKMQGQFTSATSSITQKAMHKAMELDYETYIKPMRDAFLKRRDLVLKLMKEIPGLKTNTPQGAFYVYPEVSFYFGKKYKDYTINNATDLSLYLLDEGHLALVPGAAFGEDRYIRFSYATSEQNLTEALKRMK